MGTAKGTKRSSPIQWGHEDGGLSFLGKESLCDLTSWPKAGKKPGKVTAVGQSRQERFAGTYSELRTEQGNQLCKALVVLQLSSPCPELHPRQKRRKRTAQPDPCGQDMNIYGGLRTSACTVFTHLSLFFAPLMLIFHYKTAATKTFFQKGF